MAYFVGCTARHLYPEVAKSAVNFFERNGFEVFVPEQRCCGMPSLLEGDKTRAVALARFSKGELDLSFEPVFGKAAYFPPCHLREQKIESPYLDLMAKVKQLKPGHDCHRLPELPHAV